MNSFLRWFESCRRYSVSKKYNFSFLNVHFSGFIRNRTLKSVQIMFEDVLQVNERKLVYHRFDITFFLSNGTKKKSRLGLKRLHNPRMILWLVDFKRWVFKLESCKCKIFEHPNEDCCGTTHVTRMVFRTFKKIQEISFCC